MKELQILRHGKSDWKAVYGADHERPLAPRGQRAAADLGRVLAWLDRAPEKILCSTARRTQETAEGAMRAGQWNSALEMEPMLYGASVQEVLALIRQQRVDRLMIVGHEPTCSSLVRACCGASVRFPTATLAGLVFYVSDWSDITAGNAELHYFYPARAWSRLPLSA